MMQRVKHGEFHSARVGHTNWQNHLSNDKKPGCLGYIGDDKLPSYVGDCSKT